MKYIVGILLVVAIFFVSIQTVSAILPDPNPVRPEIDVGDGGGKSIVRILLETLFGGKGVKVDVPNVDISPTPDAGTTGTPFPTGNVTIPPGLGLNPGFNYPQNYVDNVTPCLQNKGVYLQVQSMTGVPWQVIGGIHFVEGSCGPTKSCVSGRQIGTNEPDVHGNCSASNSGLGLPDPLPTGGCGFSNLLDSCIYGANHLKGKIGNVPQNIRDLAKALGRYNGIGNANCGKTPFTGCPPPYEGYDHIYPFSKFDAAHMNMYLVYCADYTVCNPPRPFNRIGVLTAASILARY